MLSAESADRDGREGGPPPILVTGSHRSGTTWVGRVLARSPRVGYIGEPFSLTRPPGICSATFPHWYTYVSAENQGMYLRALEDTLRFRYDFLGAARARPGPRRAARNLLDAARFTTCRVRRCRPLMKDPLAFFSAPWLEETFGMQVVVMIRHPAAFVASLKVKGWSFSFEHLASQPALLNGPLVACADEVMSMASFPGDLIAQGILLWRIIHRTIADYQRRYDGWIFLRHEDLANDPLGRYREVFDVLNLEFTSEVQRFIRTSSEGPKVGEHDAVRGIVRDSGASVRTWKTRLEPEEIDRIRDGTEDVAPAFYGDRDW